MVCNIILNIFDDIIVYDKLFEVFFWFVDIDFRNMWRGVVDEIYDIIVFNKINFVR